jgi:hypothetical protein
MSATFGVPFDLVIRLLPVAILLFIKAVENQGTTPTSLD